MKLANLIACTAALGLAAAPAFAGEAQRVATVSGASDVLVVREGKVVSVQPGAALQSGDRVVTRGSAGAKVSFANGCAIDVPAASTVTVGASACGAPVQSLAMSRASFPMKKANAADGGTWVVGGLALAAVIGGIIAATSGDSSPASP